MSKESKAVAMTTEEIQKSQAEYKGKEITDLVEVTIEVGNKYYKVGDVDLVHPATAEILKAKGLIKSYKKVDRDVLTKKAEKELKEFEAELLS